jgi:cytochrome c oxidase cbb3-type subunit 3
MPAFGEFLGDDRVHVLAAYVWSLSNEPAHLGDPVVVAKK